MYVCRRVCPLAREACGISSDGSLCSHLPGTGAEGNLEHAVEEDKALLRNNLSASAVQWHGDAALRGRRFLLSCHWSNYVRLLWVGSPS